MGSKISHFQLLQPSLEGLDDKNFLGNCNAVIKVRDTGIGIPKHQLTRIFDRFYRVSSDRFRNTSGFGLGLAIVQRHQDKLNVQSELGKGNTFTFNSPLDGENLTFEVAETDSELPQLTEYG